MIQQKISKFGNLDAVLASPQKFEKIKYPKSYWTFFLLMSEN
jgi:hypothetical protein